MAGRGASTLMLPRPYRTRANAAAFPALAPARLGSCTGASAADTPIRAMS
jgi:hypothetical protein